MVQQIESTMESVVQFVLDKRLSNDSTPGQGGSLNEWNELASIVMQAGLRESRDRAEAHREEVTERNLQREAGVLDEGQDDYERESYLDEVDSDDDEHVQALSKLGIRHGVKDTPSFPTCFYEMCRTLGVTVPKSTRAVSELSYDKMTTLRSVKGYMIGYDMFSSDDTINHVFVVPAVTKASKVVHQGCDTPSVNSCIHGVTSPQEFFNEGGSLYHVKFYMNDPEFHDNNETVGPSLSQFGNDLPSLRGDGTPSQPTNFPNRPESVVNGGATGGSANMSGGVVRPKRRNIKARSDFITSTDTLRTYGVSSAMMFNNLEEMYLNTISKEFGQEIIEDVFSAWGLPMDEPTVMKYAEDVLWAFIIARTASNKADYKFALDIPTKSGVIEVNFDLFSRMLADKYGVTRRNFARGMADNLRTYLRVEGNQHLRSLSAQRIGADPQMGDLCFDGSTGCTSLTSSETQFTRILEARNLYERDDVIAEGASDRLMQGMSGGVRSIVPR